MNLIDRINLLRIELFVVILLCAVIFFQIQQKTEKTLLSLVVITLWLVGVGYYLKNRSESIDTAGKKEVFIVEKENTTKLEAPEVACNNFYVKKAPIKGLSFLKKNESLMQIAQDLIFVKTFDAQKYQDMLIFMNLYQKVYMYILAGRYYPKSYVPTFLDLRENILEIMYQYYVVVPSSFKHIYGVRPYDHIEKNIHAFLKVSRLMIVVLENYCRLDLKEPYFPSTNPMPYDVHNQKDKKYVLP
jgi:hypothetical protein